MEHPDPASVDAGGVFPGLQPAAAGLDAGQTDRGIRQKGRKDSHRVAAAPDTGDHLGRKLPLLFEDLPPRFAPDHRLKVADHLRIRVGTGDRADHVKGVLGSGDPVADRLVHRILQRGGTALDCDHPAAQRDHAIDIGRLAFHVNRSHENIALHAEEGRHRRGADAVHPGAGLRDQPALSHPPCQQRLTERIVDLVGAGVIEVLAFEVDLRAADRLGEPPGVVERRLPPDVIGQKRIQFLLKRGIGLRFPVLLLQFDQGRHQSFGDILSAVDSIVGTHFCNSFTILKKSIIFLFDFTPGELSSELERSTPAGFTCPTASATFSAEIPPASITGHRRAASAATLQSHRTPLPPEAASSTKRSTR